MGNWIEATGKTFERLLRWLYPGILFLILLYLFKKPSFEELIHIRGYPWPLIIGGLGVGAVIYLIQINVVNAIISGFAQKSNWLALMSTHNLNEERPKPHCYLTAIKNWFKIRPDDLRDWFDKQADNIECSGRDKDISDYMAYANATYHATCITGWLTPIFYWIREDQSLLYGVGSCTIWVFSGVMLFASLYLFAKLSRVRY